ncbi:MAG: hypothetical protein JWN78_726 [Bacteroidota bacterium]|nr:hypothetical protein [Bacteroidota bacterium]
MISLILFDLGKVIFDYSWNNTFLYWSDITGIPLEEIQSRFVLNEIWNEYECGKKSPQEICRFINSQINIKLTQKEFEEGCNNIYLELYEGINELLMELKNKYRIAALTNTNEVHCKVWLKRYENTLVHFEKIFISNEMGMRKPDKNIYLQTLKQLNVQPQEVLFLDDLKENIESAKSIGIHTIQVSSFQQMKTELQKYRM